MTNKVKEHKHLIVFAIGELDSNLTNLAIPTQNVTVKLSNGQKFDIPLHSLLMSKKDMYTFMDKFFDEISK